MNTKWKSQIQERLLSLYLRLNGYFVSGFILHSPIPGQNLAEIDLLAVRFPHNKELERQIDTDEILEPSNAMVDLAICEVKGGNQQLRFNSSLLASADRIGTVLRWAGLYSQVEIDELAPKVLSALSPTQSPQSGSSVIIAPRGTRVRGLLFGPDRNARRNNQPWFIPGSAMLAYISRCFCPPGPRATCSTTYDFGLWHDHENIVRYIKRRGPENVGTMRDLYSYFAKPGTT